MSIWPRFMKQTPAASRILLLSVLLVAASVAVFGISKLISTAAPVSSSEEATIDGLTAEVTTAGWTTMDHDMSGGDSSGFQMPPAMMPGMPENDDQRLAVTVTVTNTGDGTRPLRPGTEFALRAGEAGQPHAPHSHTFGELPRLAAHNAVTGVLFFDLSPAELADSTIWVEWTHGDATGRLTIPRDGVGAGPGHSEHQE